LRDFFSLIIKPHSSQVGAVKPVPTVTSPFLQKVEAMREVQQMQHWVINSLWNDNPALARELRSGTRDIVHPNEEQIQLKKLVETADLLLNKQKKPVDERTEKAFKRILNAAPMLLNGSVGEKSNS
jgi:replication initiation and membrane attachment protein DnaB